MPCQSTAFAFNAPCAMPPGGIRTIYVADPAAVRITAFSENEGTISIGAAQAGAKPFYKWDVAPGQSTMQTEAQISEANNVRFFATDLVAALNNFQPTDAGANLLNKLHRLAIIVKLNSGVSLFLGLVNTVATDVRPITVAVANVPRGADVTAFTWTPGQAKGDAIRANLTAHLDSSVMPLVITNYDNLINE